MKANMGLGTDCLGLTNHRIFEIFREGLESVSSKTQNIIECKGDVLYLWNPLEQNVLSVNIKNLKEQQADGPSYQTLLATDPPAFGVESLLASETGAQLALWGPRGAAVMDLPRKWGPRHALASADTLQCRTRTLDERYFVCNPFVAVLRARWHPGSDTDSLLVLLTSENTLRVYESLGAPSVLRAVWALGPAPRASLASAPRVPFLVGLGDTAVDFDFAAPELPCPPPTHSFKENFGDGTTDKAQSTAIQWPMLVLHGNGDVSKVVGSLKDDRTCTVQGPLHMFPPADDNYGADACAILVLPTTPPLVALAGADGTLYHCALLSPSSSPSPPHTPPQPALYVLECVELELGFALDDEVNALSCPIHLKRHPAAHDRYLCSHDAGVHSVALPLVPYLEHYVNADDELALLETPISSQASIVEYLVCTRTANTEHPAPVLGLTFAQTLAQAPDMMMVVLLASGEVLSLTLPMVVLPKMGIEPQGHSHHASGVEFASPLKQLLKEPFDSRIKNILKRNSSQPILKLSSGSNPSPREILELVARTTKTFREEYLIKHDQVREEIERRVRTLKALKQHQEKELLALEAERGPLQEEAERLAEKYEDAKDKQEELSNKAKQVLRLIVQKQPITSNAEKKHAKELEAIRERLEQFKKGLEQVQAKQNYHKEQVQLWQAQQCKRDVYLSQTRASTIRHTLSNVTEDIAELVRAVHSIKEDLKM